MGSFSRHQLNVCKERAERVGVWHRYVNEATVIFSTLQYMACLLVQLGRGEQIILSVTLGASEDGATIVSP